MYIVRDEPCLLRWETLFRCARRIRAVATDWVIVRTGADVKIRCQGCGRTVMLDRAEFEKRVKKILQHAGENADE